MANPYAKYLVPAEPQVYAPAEDPIVKPAPTPDPFKVRDQQLQEEAAARAREDQQFQRTKFEREMGVKDRDAIKATEQENNNKAYYQRALRALQTYDEKDMGPRSYAGSTIASLPFNSGDALLKALPDFIGDSPDRRISEQAKRDFAQIILRSDSGANAPEPEVERLVSTFFPSVGETDPAVLANYSEARRQALEGLRSKAGRFAPELPAYTPKEQTAGRAATDAETDDANSVAALQQRFGGGGLVGAVTDETPSNPDTTKRQIDATGAALYGVADTVTAGFADEIAAGLGAAFGTGAGTFGDRYEANLATERAVRDRLREENRPAYTAGQIGGALTPFGIGAFGRGVATVRGAAGVGALQGGAYGVGSVDGNIADRGMGGVLGAGLGAAGGAAAGYAVPKVASAFSGIANSPARVAARQSAVDARINAAPIIRAADAEGVPISRPIVDPSVRNTVTALETTRGGNPIVREGLDRTANALEAGVDRLAGNGTARDASSAGEVVQQAGSRFIDRSRSVAGRMYARAERLAGGATATPTKALQALDGHIAELKAAGENANSPQITYLEGLKADLSRGPMSIEALRSLRSQMRGQINSRNLTATDAERRVTDVLGQASQDIEAALGGNTAALQAYKKADGFYRERQTYINDVLRRFMGRRDQPISSEQAFAKLQQMAGNRGDSRRLSEMMRSLDPQEATDIAATFAANLGRDAAGNFSPTLLATQAEKMSPRALETIFGPEGARSLRNLTTVAKEFRDLSRNLNNSRTGVAVNYRSWLGRVFGLGGAGIGFASSGGIAAVAGGVAARSAGQGIESVLDARTARLLMNPDVTAWLKAAPSTTSSQAINRHAAKLERIAQRTPYLASDIQALQQRLIEAARLSGPSAAEEKQDSRVRPEQ